MLLKDKVAIVTGSAQGIGSAIAKKFSENGAKVVLCDIKEEKVVEAAKEIKKQTGFDTMGVYCDITKKENIEKVAAKVVETYGRIDILVNNAAVLILGSFLDYEENTWDKVMAVNVKGAFLFSQIVGKIMAKQGGGKIINMSSCAAKKAVENHVAYCTAKAAITGLTRMTALELGQYGITCNAICPGITDTDMVRTTFLTNPVVEKEWAEKNVLKRIGKMEDQAKAALMLASDLSDYITGESIIVSAGEIMGQ